MTAYTDFVAEIRDLIAPHLRAGLDAGRYAAAVVDEMDCATDSTYFEIRASHTKAGNPVMINVTIPAALRDTEE